MKKFQILVGEANLNISKKFNLNYNFADRPKLQRIELQRSWY